MTPSRPAIPLLVLLLAALLATGCGDDAGGDLGPDDRPSKDQPRTKLLIDHDFDDPKSTDWIRAPGGAFRDGGLLLSAQPDQLARSGAARDLEVSDVRVEVTIGSEDARGDDAAFGVLCRWTFDARGRSRDYYAFTISPNGHAAIGTSREFLWQAVTPVEAVRTGPGASNDVRAECVGDQLSLYVNDALVRTVTDDLLTTGDVGVTLENYGTKRRAMARFDDFRAAQVL